MQNNNKKNIAQILKNSQPSVNN